MNKLWIFVRGEYDKYLSDMNKTNICQAWIRDKYLLDMNKFWIFVKSEYDIYLSDVKQEL